jgi:hypothetical protein
LNFSNLIHLSAQSTGYPDSLNSISVAFSSNIKLPKGSKFILQVCPVDCITSSKLALLLKQKHIYPHSLQGLGSAAGIVLGSEIQLIESLGGSLPTNAFGPCATFSSSSCGQWNATMPGILNFTVLM